MGERTARENARQLALPEALVVAAILTITALGFFIFPGHTYLQQDTQIYVPMLEQLWNPALYARELITSRPHLSWTAYDEIALLLRHISGLDFKSILLVQEFLFRALGLWGVYLMARSMHFSQRQSLLVAGIFALGATIVGPAVLTFEYEPTPRSFAIMLVFLAIGLTLSERIGWASLAGAVAFLYHAPTAIPFWALFGIVAIRGRCWRAFAILAAAAAVLIVLSRAQPGIVHPQPLFSRISPFLERLQRMRASYNWVSAWNSAWFWHYAILLAFVTAAVYRIRDRLANAQRIMIPGLVLIGVLSVPISYVGLEQLKWSLISQFQPARYVLFITAMAVIMGCAAGIDAAIRQHYAETFAWLLIPFAIPALVVVAPPYQPPALLVVGVLAITGAAVLALDRIQPRVASAAVLLLTASAMLSIPVFAGVRNYPELWTPGIQDVSKWARTHTDQAAVFAFPYAGKRLYPGLFRAEALRAVYVDWKAGGQANYFEDLARQWWARWQSTMAPGSKPEYSSRDVDYIVVERNHADPSLTPVYANSEYIVYRTGAQSG